MPMLRVTTEIIEDEIKEVDLVSFKNGFLAAKKGRAAKFLIIRDVGWGDVLLIATAMRSMYDFYEGIELYLSTLEEYRKVIERLPWIKGTFCIKEGPSPDLVFDIAIDLRQKFDYLPICREAHRLDLIHGFLRIPIVHHKFNLKATKEDVNWALTTIADKGGMHKDRYTIGVHYSSYAEIRSWDWAEEFVQLAFKSNYNVITFQDTTVDMLDHKGNGKNVTGIVRTHGRETRVSGMLGLLHHCDVVVCPDSGVMHTCGMMGIPFVALFGSVPPELRDSYYSPKRSIFLRELPCVPCYDWQVNCCSEKPYFKQCLLKITPEAVLLQVESLLREVKSVRKVKDAKVDSLSPCLK